MCNILRCFDRLPNVSEQGGVCLSRTVPAFPPRCRGLTAWSDSFHVWLGGTQTFKSPTPPPCPQSAPTPSRGRRTACCDLQRQSWAPRAPAAWALEVRRLHLSTGGRSPQSPQQQTSMCRSPCARSYGREWREKNGTRFCRVWCVTVVVSVCLVWFT